MPIIETRNLRKVFRSVKRYPGLGGAVRSLFTREYVDKAAVEDVTLAMEPGELVGYIGPNGAGKSTTIKMLTGILVPTSGEIHVAGLVPHEKRKENARNIGVVFGQRSQLYWDLPLQESFELLRAIYAVPRDRYRANLARFSEILALDEFMETPVRQLSLGQRMRGDFAAAMLHDPQIVYLDEPTIGLDVVAKEAIREFIAQINEERGTTVILTTHDLADVERLCNRIILIDDGRVVFDGGIERLRNEYGTHRTLVVTLAENCESFDFPHTELVEREGNLVHLKFDRRRITAEQLIRAVTERCTISDVSIVEPELEDIIRRIYLEGYQHQAQAPAPSS
ncbi:MAG: ATP-binding cassette domain-containing protein [Candidatus Eremiobacteraeota bacterium]|nr:ATP-binding cassette domain-containing protein [Candidatus Eremiobacteraeota bacterium]